MEYTSNFHAFFVWVMYFCTFPEFTSKRVFNVFLQFSGMKQCMDSENLHRRLKRIAGQISGLERLIDEDVPCEEILIQVNAIKSAIHKVGQIILVGHINHCVKDGIEHGDADKTLAEFAEVLEQYSKI